MKKPTSNLLTRHHATMVSMTSLRKDWPQRQFRLDEPTMKQVRSKMLDDGEKFQPVMETLARAWVAGLVDVKELRSELEKRGLLAE